MNNKKSTVWRLPAVFSILWLIASSALFIILYGNTKYLPLLLGGIALLLPTLVFLVCFVLYGLDVDVEKAVEPLDAQARGIKKILLTLAYGVKVFFRGLRRAFVSRRDLISALLVCVISVGGQVWFWLMFRRATSVYRINYVMPVILVVLFVSFIIFESWCSHSGSEDTRATSLLRNIRTAFALGRILIIIDATAMVVKLLGFYDLLRIADIAIAVVIIYETILILLSLSVKLIRHEMATDPDISIPMPFAIGSSKDLGVIVYLEKNTGITMRSLWSIKLIRKLVPYTVVLALLLFWVCTGIVQIESYQEGAVYRFGRLRDETITPGIHLTLPWPFDKVKVYNTDQVNTMTIGYISSEATDNTWTGTHGSSEYKLLLGGGNELVSINLRLEYKICDLTAYLRTCKSPERLLEAKAYELVTDRTIITDLDSLLSADRHQFAESFRVELAEMLGEYDTGLELVGVVLESIHPPIEIASTYQDIVGAEIKAEKYILDAEAAAAVAIAKAEKSYDSAVSEASADSCTKIAAASADVAEFMASVAADNAYPDNYRYYKYLSAIGRAYGSSRLVIVGDGIDSSKIYLGGILIGQ